MLARIFRPAKTAMQSGKARTEMWILEYEPEKPSKIDPLMGYTSSADMRQQIRLEFASRDEAVSYAERNGIPFRLVEDHKTPVKIQSYADNFRYNRPQQWTH